MWVCHVEAMILLTVQIDLYLSSCEGNTNSKDRTFYKGGENLNNPYGYRLNIRNLRNINNENQIQSSNHYISACLTSDKLRKPNRGKKM